MAKILGLDELNKVLNDFLVDFECTAYADTDFYCVTATNEIAYALVVTESCSKSFMKRVEKLYPDVHADEFLWSFLHEVGHVETVDELTEEEEKYCMYQKEQHPTNEEYYELLDEYLATEWAANYMRKNATDIKDFWKKIQTAILNIYTLNNVVV